MDRFLGHLNIIQRAAGKFDKLVIAIGGNPEKESPIFSLEERKQFLKTITTTIPNVEIASFSGLLVDFAKSVEINVIIRAIRTIFDFESETQQAAMNRKIGEVETFFLSVDEKYRLINSTLVREVASHGKKVQGFVPLEIEEAVFHRFSNK